MLYNYAVFITPNKEGDSQYYDSKVYEEADVATRIPIDAKEIWVKTFAQNSTDRFEDHCVLTIDMERSVCLVDGKHEIRFVLDKRWVENNTRMLDLKQHALARHLGRDLCDLQMIEELAELQKALTKYYRATHGGFTNSDMDALRENIVEEVADVIGCLQNVRVHYGITDIEIQRERSAKLKRAFERYNISNPVPHI